MLAEEMSVGQVRVFAEFVCGVVLVFDCGFFGVFGFVGGVGV
jgi:hypothetical protein